MAESKHTPGPWHLCHHLESAEKDASCPCGYRGGIWGSDEEHVVCEMGSADIAGEEGLSPPRYPRAVELANARLIAAAPDLLEALRLVLPAAEHAYHTGAFADIDGGDWWSRILQAREAIAKATPSDTHEVG